MITTNDDDEANALGRKQYLSTMRKRNDVEEWLEKCDSLEFSLQLALAKEDYDLAAKIKKELEPNADDEDDINFSMLCDLCRRVSSPASSAITADDEVEAITVAAKKLGLVGDPRALPALARALAACLLLKTRKCTLKSNKACGLCSENQGTRNSIYCSKRIGHYARKIRGSKVRRRRSK